MYFVTEIWCTTSVYVFETHNSDTFTDFYLQYILLARRIRQMYTYHNFYVYLWDIWLNRFKIEDDVSCLPIFSINVLCI